MKDMGIDEARMAHDLAEVAVRFIRDSDKPDEAAAGVCAALMSILVPMERTLRIPIEAAMEHYKVSHEMAEQTGMGFEHVVAMAAIAPEEAIRQWKEMEKPN